MENIYWSYESWGSDYPPGNYEDIVTTANGLIDQYISNNHLDMDDWSDAEIARDYSIRLWDEYCRNGSIAE